MRAYLSRRYRFSASHRLHAESYSAERNREMFGKCNNPHGHGHNYVVEVKFGGGIDAVTGMVCDLGELDAFTAERLLARFDHRNLNTLAEFTELVPTTENLAVLMHRIFAEFRGAELVNVHVEETGNNSFDYSGSKPQGGL